MAATRRATPLLSHRNYSFSRSLVVSALVSVLACGSAGIARAAEPGAISIGSSIVSRVVVGVGKPALSRPGGEVRLDDHISIARGAAIPLVGAAASDRPSRDVALRPTEQTSQTVTATDLGVRPAGLANNYRGTTFVPWLETLSLINDEFGGYAGSPGLHSQWSSEIDQWIAMVDTPGALGSN